MMEQYDYQLTEEIARWRFEVFVKSCPAWYIAFTNPTAGPWKRVMEKREDGVEGEVYRFVRDEDRPDLILVCDDLKTIAIIEAKDSLAKLQVDDQLSKSAQVVEKLSGILSRLGDNKFWNLRSRYSVCAGLLWGGETGSSAEDREDLIERFKGKMGNRKDNVIKQYLCIEVIRNSASDDLEVSIYVPKPQEGIKGLSAAALLKTFTPGR
jgi:hypothetical protein